MKIYRLCYDSFGDELLGGDEFLFLTKLQAERYRDKMIADKKGKAERFSIEELNVIEEENN